MSSRALEIDGEGRYRESQRKKHVVEYLRVFSQNIGRFWEDIVAVLEAKKNKVNIFLYKSQYREWWDKHLVCG